MTDLSKRIVIRLSEQQLAWIEAWAADEGMDNSTFVRVVLDRLSKGRPPLIGMMTAGEAHYDHFSRTDAPMKSYNGVGIREVEELKPSGSPATTLADEIDEIENATRDVELPGKAQPIARSPGLVERQRYNPGRQ